MEKNVTHIHKHTASRYKSNILPNKATHFRHVMKIGPEILTVSMRAVRCSTKSSVFGHTCYTMFCMILAIFRISRLVIVWSLLVRDAYYSYILF